MCEVYSELSEEEVEWSGRKRRSDAKVKMNKIAKIDIVFS